MKVVFGNFIFGYLLYGGAEVQLEQTRLHLLDLGVDVQLFSQWDKDILENVDIVHWFHIDPGSYQVFKLAKQRGIKIVISSIFWPLHNELIQAIWTRISSLPRYIGVPFSSYATEQRNVLNMADAIIVSSKSEGKKICKIFGVSKDKIYVIPVGVSEAFINASPDLFISKYNLKDFILCVGRIEPRKNQLNLLRATKDIDIPVVMIGDYTVCPEYYEKCLKVKHPNAYFLGKMNHNDELLRSAYAAAKILVMPSTLEFPGLAALEAALAGTRIVVTKYGNTYEYFEDLAEYVDPYSVSSIKEGILKALNASDLRIKKLRDKILANFTWPKIVRGIYDVYQRLLTKA